MKKILQLATLALLPLISSNTTVGSSSVSPVLNISIVGTNAELSWDDTHPFDVHYSNDLSVWTNTNINTSPHSRALSTSEFFKLIESESEPYNTVSLYVSGGDFSSPYYTFYMDSAGTQELSPDRTLYLDTKYVFYRLNNATSHPFYISDAGFATTATSSIAISGDGATTSGITGSQSFALIFNGLAEGDTLSYYCSAHASMVSTFNLLENTPEPEPDLWVYEQYKIPNYDIQYPGSAFLYRSIGSNVTDEQAIEDARGFLNTEIDGSTVVAFVFFTSTDGSRRIYLKSFPENELSDRLIINSTSNTTNVYSLLYDSNGALYLD
jgi:hypothetical protein